MITSRPLGSTAYIDYTLVHLGTGAAYTVASVDDITVRVFDSTSGTPMAGSIKTYARDTGNPGSYYAVVPIGTSTFTIGAVYNVVVQVTIAGIDSKGVIETFVVQPPVLIGTVATGTGTASASTFKSNVELPETPSTIFTTANDVRLWLRSSDEITFGTPPAVATMGDRTSYSHDANQSTAGNRPVISSGVVDFDHASSHRLIVTHTADINQTTTMTLAARIRVDRVSTAEGVITKSPASTGTWSIQNASGELRFWFAGVGVDGGYVTGAFSAGNWYTMIWVYDGTQTGNSNRLKLWLNGVAQTLSFFGTVPASLSTTTNDIVIGDWGNFVQPFNGAVAEVVLANPAATSDQVARLNTLLTSRGTDHWKDCLITFTSGVLAGQVQKVSGYNGDSTYFTVGNAYSATPTVGDKFLILNH